MTGMGQTETSTPSGVRVVAVLPDGSEHNITEGVQVLYDHLIQSMDWGSGFLTIEDVEPIVALARLCGFKGYEEAEGYMARELKAEKQRKCLHPTWHEEPTRSPGYVYMVCDECEMRRLK